MKSKGCISIVATHTSPPIKVNDWIVQNLPSPQLALSTARENKNYAPSLIFGWMRLE